MNLKQGQLNLKQGQLNLKKGQLNLQVEAAASGAHRRVDAPALLWCRLRFASAATSRTSARNACERQKRGLAVDQRIRHAEQLLQPRPQHRRSAQGQGRLLTYTSTSLYSA